jgi:hypothetical protein
VLTQPVELPLYGRLERTSYEKEELVELCARSSSKKSSTFECSEVFQGCEPAVMASGSCVLRRERSARGTCASPSGVAAFRGSSASG